MAKPKQYEVKITSAVLIDGEVQKPGVKVTVDRRLAVNLLQRGKAVLPTGAPDPAAPEATIATGAKAGGKRAEKKPAPEAEG